MANHIDNQLHLFALVGSWEEREPSKKFDQNATQGPHVNLSCVREQAEHDVRCTVEARLDVSVNDLMGETTRAKISHHDP